MIVRWWSVWSLYCCASSGIAEECTEARAASFAEPVFSVEMFDGTIDVPSRYVVFAERILESETRANVELKSLMRFGAPASQIGSITFGNRDQLGDAVLTDADRTCTYGHLNVRVKRGEFTSLAFIFDDAHYMSISGADGALWPAILASYRRTDVGGNPRNATTSTGPTRTTPTDLGAQLLPVIERGRMIGYRVSVANENSPLAQAGLRSGDIITAVEGQDAFYADDIATLLRRGPVDVTVLSPDGARRSIRIPGQ